MHARTRVSRRRFIAMAATGTTAALVAACTQPAPTPVPTVAPVEATKVPTTAPTDTPAAPSATAQPTPAAEKPAWLADYVYFEPPKPEDYPWDDMSKKVKLSLVIPAGWGEPMRGPDKDPFHAFLNKRMNADIDVIADPDVFQRVQLMVAAGDIPDLILGPSRAQYVEMINQGITVPDLIPLAEQYMPNYVNKLLGGDWTRLRQAMVKGKLIAAAPPAASQAGFGLFVRERWLDALGFAVPKTMDDVLEQAIAFREKDPDGNGARDTYGLVFWVPTWAKDTNPYGELGPFSGLFGAPDGFFVRDGALSCGWWTPGRKGWVEWVKQLHDAGGLLEDWATLDPSTFWERLGRADYGFHATHGWNMFTGKYALQPQDAPNFALVDDLAGPAGKAMEWAPVPTLQWTISNQVAKDETRLKRLLHMMDEFALCSSDLSIVFNNFWGFGIEDWPLKHLPKVEFEDWTVSVDLTDVEDWLKNSDLGQTPNQWFNMVWGRWFHTQLYFRDKVPVYVMAGYRSDEVYLPWVNKISKRPTYEQALITPDSNTLADLHKHRVENEMRFIFGRRPLSEWDAYIAEQLKMVGGRNVLEAGLKELQENGQPITTIDSDLLS